MFTSISNMSALIYRMRNISWIPPLSSCDPEDTSRHIAAEFLSILVQRSATAPLVDCSLAAAHRRVVWRSCPSYTIH